MIFSISLVELINCWRCAQPASYVEVADPRYDSLGLLEPDLPVTYSCSAHLSSPRSPYRPTYDCLYRGCGPEHCDYPTCKEAPMVQRDLPVPRSITYEQYLGILKTYGFNPDEIVHMYLDHRGITAELYRMDETGRRIINDGDTAITYEVFVPVKG